MLKILRGGFEWREEIVQHGQIGFHLVFLKPAFDQTRLFVQRRINQMGHVRHAAKDFRAAGRIRQIDRNDLGAFESVRDTARNPNHVPIVLLREVLDRGVTDQTGRTRHQHLFLGHGKFSFRTDKTRRRKLSENILPARPWPASLGRSGVLLC